MTLRPHVLIILCVGLLAISAAAQGKKEEPQYPTKEEVLSALEDSERALLMYEQDIATVELTLGQKLDKDREVLKNTRLVISKMKSNPASNFTSAAAMLLLSGLDDASRNEGIMGMQMLTAVVARIGVAPSKSVSDLHLVQAIQRTDQLLYMASDKVFKLGLKRAEADQALVEQSYAAVTQCMSILKEQKAKGK